MRRYFFYPFTVTFAAKNIDCRMEEMGDTSSQYTVEGFLSYIKGCTQLYVLKVPTPTFGGGVETPR